MTRLPRDISGQELCKGLENVFGYKVTRQSGSHIRLTTAVNGEHHVTVPNHASIRLGTLAGIVGDVSLHFKISRDETVRKLFER